MSLLQNARAIQKAYIDACNSILYRGGKIASGAPIGDLAHAILGIPHDQTLAYHTVSQIGTHITIPQQVEKYAKVDKIGGMSYKCNNFISFPYYRTSGTYQGVTWTINDDYSITATGSSNTGNYADFKLHYKDWIIPQGTYTISGIPDGFGTNVKIRMIFVKENGTNAKILDVYGTPQTFTVDFEYAYIDMYIRPSLNTSWDNVTFYPMLNVGSTALPYEPYFKGIRNTKVTELRSIGANLIPFPYPEGSVVRKGVTFTMNDDGSITLNGTTTEDGGYVFNTYDGTPMPKGTYTLSGLLDGSNTTYYLQVYFDRKAKGTVTNKPYTFNFDGNGLSVRFYFKTGVVFDNFTIYPMLNRGAAAAPYKSYIKDAVDTFSISAELRTFLEDKGYGRGINSTYYNYIDFARKVFVQNTKNIIFNGTEKWDIAGTREDGFVNLRHQPIDDFNINKASLSICLLYNYDNTSFTSVTKEGYTLSASTPHSLLIRTKQFTTVDEWKAHLAELYANGDPLIVEYILATPVEYDISAYLTDDSFIEVNGSGTIIPINEHEYEYAVPVELTYLINTVAGG